MLAPPNAATQRAWQATPHVNSQADVYASKPHEQPIAARGLRWSRSCDAFWLNDHGVKAWREEDTYYQEWSPQL